MEERIMNICGIRKKTILCRIKDYKNKYFNVIMKGINKDEEDIIDKFINNEYTTVDLDDIHISNSKHIYLYGEVNVKDKKDINIIYNFDLINHDIDNYIYSTFNYDKGTISINGPVVKRYPSRNCLDWFKFHHCLIGKPQRIIVYKNHFNL